ncbi:MAG: serine hydrolase [Rubritalea sp.]|uniref:D-alanyl-D-alanine carboxypeptidase family protein n=1 Tax=Rubritalea sp. TaxID=2109375 RepID=UPI003241CF15
MIRFLIPVLLFTFTFTSLAGPQLPESYIVLERHSRKVLLASGSEHKRPIASLSHMVTAKVALDWAKASGTSTTTMLVVPQHRFHKGIDNPLGLHAGDQLSMRDALYATILGEDSVSAMTLASHVGSQLLNRRQLVGDPQSVFVNEMNHLTRSLGMRSTRFYLPSGGDSNGRKNVSTASDVARLSHTLSTDTAYGFYAKQKQRSLKILKRDGRESRIEVLNSNKLLRSKIKVVGMKTASSPTAGQCASLLVDKYSYVKKLPTGEEQVTPVQMILVILGSSDIENFAMNLIPQGWTQYESWRNGGYMSSPDRREFLKVF